MLALTCLLLALYAVFSLSFYFLRLRPTRGENRFLFSPPPDSERARARPGGAGRASGPPGWQETFDAIIDPVLILDTDLRVSSQPGRTAAAVDQRRAH